MYRVGHNFADIGDADTIERARQIVQGAVPGRFVIVEIRDEPFPSGLTRRTWGRMIRHPDGGFDDESWPWDRAFPPSSRILQANSSAYRSRLLLMISYT